MQKCKDECCVENRVGTSCTQRVETLYHLFTKRKEDCASITYRALRGRKPDRSTLFSQTELTDCVSKWNFEGVRKELGSSTWELMCNHGCDTDAIFPPNRFGGLRKNYYFHVYLV